MTDKLPGGRRKIEINPMKNYATRPGHRCRLHGGLSPGAPRGLTNGNYKTGDWTSEAIPSANGCGLSCTRLPRAGQPNDG